MKKLAENDRKHEEIFQELRENDKKFEEDRKKLNEHDKRLDKTLDVLDYTVGALGARWGRNSEAAFRDGLRAILKDKLDAEVINFLDYDEKGYVFGRPDQVEIDVVVHNKEIMLVEIKSSLSKADIYIFKRKVEFYEQKHKKKANRIIVISPMIDPIVYEIAGKLGIEVYTSPVDVKR